MDEGIEEIDIRLKEIMIKYEGNRIIVKPVIVLEVTI